MRKFFVTVGLLTGLIILSNNSSAQARPYMQSFKCHDGFEPGRWYEFTLSINNVAEMYELKVARLKSFSEDPYGERSEEIDYSANAFADFPKIRGKNRTASIELVLGNQLTRDWDLREATVTEKTSGGANSQPVKAKCVFVGAKP